MCQIEFVKKSNYSCTKRRIFLLYENLAEAVARRCSVKKPQPATLLIKRFWCGVFL